MAIITISVDVAGQTGNLIGGVAPRRVAITTTDNLAAVTTAGYLNQAARETFVIQPTDQVCMNYSYNPQTKASTFGIFTVTISGTGVITLVPWTNPAGGDVTFTGTPVAGDFVTWNNSTGQVKDAGFLPSNAAKTNVVMANGATIVNHIGTFTDIAGTIGEDAATAINGGNLQAGLSGTAGTLASFPSTASKGSLVVAAVANTGNTNTTISNAAMGQATVVSIPDPGATTANFLLSASGGTQHITAGNFQVDAGSLISGKSTGGTVGTLQLFPTTTITGSLEIEATPNSGNTNTIITNAAFGQGTTLTIPDPGAATANFVLNTGTTTMAAGSDIKLAKVTGTEASNAVTASGQAGVITTSSLTTAGGSSYAITWTNTFIATTSVILLTIMGGTNPTENVTLTATAGSGTSTLTIYNNTTATALNGTIIIGFAVF